jgi:hypothetical protein
MYNYIMTVVSFHEGLICTSFTSWLYWENMMAEYTICWGAFLVANMRLHDFRVLNCYLTDVWFDISQHTISLHRRNVLLPKRMQLHLSKYCSEFQPDMFSPLIELCVTRPLDWKPLRYQSVASV